MVHVYSNCDKVTIYANGYEVDTKAVLTKYLGDFSEHAGIGMALGMKIDMIATMAEDMFTEKMLYTIHNSFFSILKETFEVKKRPFPWSKAINAGICGGFPIFFVLSFLMATGMPVDQSAAPLRFSIVFFSGCFSWVMSMKSYFFKRHNPEIKTLNGVYSCLAEFCEAIGNENVNDVRQRTVNALSDAEDILLSGYIPWKNSFLFNRLSLLNEQGNSLFLEMLELSFDKNNKLPIGFSRAYWIPLSCTSAMMGATIIGTFHRAVQRTIGTFVGLILAIFILSLQPKGLLLIIICVLLTGITELFIVKNYALAVIFITPNALLIAETATNIHDFSYFATARVTDILVGVSIGLIGTYLMGHRSASSPYPSS